MLENLQLCSFDLLLRNVRVEDTALRCLSVRDGSVEVRFLRIQTIQLRTDLTDGGVDRLQAGINRKRSNVRRRDAARRIAQQRSGRNAGAERNRERLRARFPDLEVLAVRAAQELYPVELRRRDDVVNFRRKGTDLGRNSGLFIRTERTVDESRLLLFDLHEKISNLLVRTFRNAEG